MDRQSRVYLPRRRALVAAFATLVALTAAGCGSDTPKQQAIGTPTIVTAQQVITSCYQNYFYNGILTSSSAKANCSSCVELRLRKLGIRPSAGETETDLLTGARLPSSAINSLQNDCNESDANEQ